MISTPSEPVTTVIRKNMIDCRKGRAALIMVLAMLVLQLSCSPVTGAALKTASEAESGNSAYTTTIATTEVAPSSTVVIVDKETTTKEQGEDDSRPTIGRNHIYSSVREKTPGLPESCADYEILQEQPKHGPATWNKCCPEEQVLTPTKTCEMMLGFVTRYVPPIINATFFNDCIEDSEVINFTMKPKIYIPQNPAMVYEESSNLDHLYILQNGSLLIVFDNMLGGYGIFNDYCLEIDPNTHTFFALAWTPDVHNEIVTGIVLSKFYKGIAFIMAISFCCLIITSALYMLVPRFRTLHGRSFALHTLNLALGYVFVAAMYFKWDGRSKMEGNQYLQYFISAAFMWQFTMCVDTVINVWYYIPKKISPIEGRHRGWIHFAIYVAFSQSIPFLFIIHHDKDSAPVNYYMSTLGEENHDDQWLFFGPILGIILLCVGMFGMIYYGFRKLNSIQSFAYIIRMKLRKQKRQEIALPFCSKEMEYVKDSARSTCFLFAIQSLCFISEIITFYLTNDSSIFFELLNALQGVFILVLFVMFPKPLQIIRQCWAGDHGSLVVEQPRIPLRDMAEKQPLKSDTQQVVGMDKE